MKIELSQSKRRTASLFSPFPLVKIKELPVDVRDFSSRSEYLLPFGSFRGVSTVGLADFLAYFSADGKDGR